MHVEQTPRPNIFNPNYKYLTSKQLYLCTTVLLSAYLVKVLNTFWNPGLFFLNRILRKARRT